MSNRDTIIAQASALQNNASDPTQNIWVNASAGTGKTKVLTDRVLRLLLPDADGLGGTAPQNIVCITFTKAGANEMIGRIRDILSKWSVMADKDLSDNLEKLLGIAPSIKQSTAAKQLFATTVDIPGGLNITTIHAFCQSVLGRFTLESGLSPNFQVTEGAPLAAFRKNIRDHFILDHLNKLLPEDVSAAFDRLANDKNADDIQSIFSAVIAQRYKIKNTTIDDIQLRAFLDLKDGDTKDSVFELFFGDDNFPHTKIKNLAEALEHGSPTNQKQAPLLKTICTSYENRRTAYNDYQSLFLKNDGEIRVVTKAITKAAREFCPEAVDIFIDEAQRILNYQEKIARLNLYQATTDLRLIASELIKRHDAMQKRMNILDYDDLIHLTETLFSGPQKDWVLYKLDYQIDHILVDEAQDTSPEQWKIILAIVEEFFSGETHRNNDIERTVFVVGDTKQSIYSFQGANIKTYTDVHTHLKNLIETSQNNFQDIPMNTSFRSADAVLSIVDMAFATPDNRFALTQNKDNPIKHIISRIGQSGSVEIWPPYKDQKADAREPWTLPTSIRDIKTAEAALSERIAKTIKHWLDNGKYSTSKKRGVQPSDIMILVRRRNSLFENIIRALKSYDIPVSGADRLVVGDYIAVEDILSALSFCILPDDDLNFACLLKSPLIGLDDAALETYAYDRQGQSLWSVYKDNGDSAITDWLSDLIIYSRRHGVYDLVCRLLYGTTPNNELTGWQAFYARLGMDSFDPLEEFLNTALSFERDDPDQNIQGFILSMQKNKSDIKREMETSQNQVRIMTVHGSKGLQAPIVICPDTMTLPKTSLNANDGFIWLDDKTPLWPSSKEAHCDVIDSYKKYMADQIYHEYCRLFYVAMTRAEDHLIVCGTLNKVQKDVPEKSWYSLARQGAVNHEGIETPWECDEDYHHDIINTAIIYNDGEDTDSQNNNDTPNQIDFTIPPWATGTYLNDNQEQKTQILSPSRPIDDESEIAYSPLKRANTDMRFRRGNLTHALLQYLPDIASENRETSGQAYLNKTAMDLSEDIRDNILKEVISILNHSDFSSYFGSGSRAEVSLSGQIGDNFISGQIDRLLITETNIWIIDYKSNRPPPTTPDTVPDIYYKQLKAYKDLLIQIYPSHEIHTALLWTDGPHMMELNVE